MGSFRNFVERHLVAHRGYLCAEVRMFFNLRGASISTLVPFACCEAHKLRIEFISGPTSQSVRWVVTRWLGTKRCWWR